MNLEVGRDELLDLGISEFLCDNLLKHLGEIEETHDPLDYWQVITRDVLSPAVPFPVHEFLYNKLAKHWQEAGPMPAYAPSVARQQSSNLAKLMNELDIHDLSELHQYSAKNRKHWWELMIKHLGITTKTPAESVLDDSKGPTEPRWLPGATMNIADSCFNASDESPAVVWRKERGSRLEYMSYDELNRASNRVANGLLAAGFVAGDAIAIDMLMNVDSICIYLGIVKAGCAVISIADSFTSGEIETRLRIGEAKGIFTVDHLARGEKKLPMYLKVIGANAPKAIVLAHGDTLEAELREGDLPYEDFLSNNDQFESKACDPHDTVNILFSSGTTGDPKAIPWNHTTPIKAAADGFCHHDIHEDDVVCWPTNLGWMMGPWLLYATLINKGTIALYNDLPTSVGFCEFVQDAQVNRLGVVPSIVKAWKNNGATDEVDWSKIQAFSSTGECSAPQDMLFLMSRANYQPVIEYIGGTEIGGGYAAGTVVHPAIPSTFTIPAFGLDLLLLDENNQPADHGELFIVPPSMGLSVTLLNKDHQTIYYHETPKGPNGETLRRHGDQMERLPNGYLRAQGRADDTMNLGGIKVSSAELERSLKGVSGLVESAAIAINPLDGGPSQLVIYAVTEGEADTEELRGRMQKAIRDNLNPLFKIHEVCLIDSLPRTASGKVMRRVLRTQYRA